jgi:hypothetical protein
MFTVLKSLSIKVAFFWGVMLCTLIIRHKHLFFSSTLKMEAAGSPNSWLSHRWCHIIDDHNMNKYDTTCQYCGGFKCFRKTCHICLLHLPWTLWVQLEILIVMPMYSQVNCKNICQKTPFHTFWLNNLHCYKYVSSLSQYLFITEKTAKLIIIY